ncbi:LacI family DNA-binding transcriptional regulator [Anaeromicropila populeti]|uniref:Transcriptional regulator, LacI family n=1 Tax=Anaeromicropila populeti TaxID=37658 RepID=A0A1I6JRB7_9FIRM|nr:LacI family DNA-binding transcriptional regulator [Anaeromicropila populeti]SFR81506.1 transcriptional regulator, LacI family [Anaeromicropila populeti]
MTKKEKRPTIKDIAKIAGVSHVTVSQALRDFSCISESTKTKVKQIAREIGYTPNLAARNLALQTPASIGMIVPTLGSETAYNEVINSLSELAAHEKLCLLLGSCNRSTELEALYCKMMCENRVGALVIASCTSDVSHIKEICDGLVPIIFIGGKTGTSVENYILPDFYNSGKIAVEHLYHLGHRKIALFLYFPDNKTLQLKKNGYLDAMEERGLEPLIYWNGENTDTFQAGFSLTEQLISRNQLPTGIWCASDLMASGVIEALKIHGIAIGKKVSVMGHDNLFFSASPSNSLTTIALPKDEIALTAMDYAKKIIAYNTDSSMPKPDCKITLKTNLIIRNSTGRLL